MKHKTIEEFLAEYETTLLGTLFAGFYYRNEIRNPDEIFKKQCAEARRLREILTQIFRDTGPTAKPEPAANGQAVRKT